MDSRRFSPAVGPPRLRVSTKLLIFGAALSSVTALATIAMLKAPGYVATSAHVTLPQPLYHWRLDYDGGDAMQRLPLRYATRDGGGPPHFRYDHDRGNSVGEFGGCRDFRCFGLALESNGPVDLEQELTISAWVNWESARFAYDHHSIFANGQIILGKRDSTFEVIAYDAHGSSVRLENSTPIVPKRWVHVVVVRTGSRLSLWVDGNESRMPYEMPTKQRGDTLYIGRNDSGYPWSGMIDDVIVWDRALDAAQIAAIQ